MSEDTDFEEIEQIPWATLAAATPDPRTRYLSIAVVVAVVVAAVAWLTLHGSGAPATAVTMASTTTAAGSDSVAAASPASTTTEPTVYSEADLMLIDLDDEERLAAMHAEWLVRDYLTVDDDPLVAERVSTLLSDVERDGTGAYVEWVRAFAITSDEPGRYRVEVAYRLLTETEGGFVRQPAGALAVELSIDVDGTARLETAPEPVAVPVLLGLEV
jgi:hypothetical protein